MRSSKFIANHMLLILGIIWLILAAAIFMFQLLNPPTITWDTATEQNTAGFQLYRSTSPDGEFVLITEEMIPSQGNVLSGSYYSFRDTHAKPGETYYYLLEEIEYDGTTNRYPDDMIIRPWPLFETWAILLIAFTTLVGIALIISGLREGG